MPAYLCWPARSPPAFARLLTELVSLPGKQREAGAAWGCWAQGPPLPLGQSVLSTAAPTGSWKPPQLLCLPDGGARNGSVPAPRTHEESCRTLRESARACLRVSQHSSSSLLRWPGPSCSNGLAPGVQDSGHLSPSFELFRQRAGALVVQEEGSPSLRSVLASGCPCHSQKQQLSRESMLFPGSRWRVTGAFGHLDRRGGARSGGERQGRAG